MAKTPQGVKSEQWKLSQLTAKSFEFIWIFSISVLRIPALLFNSADSSVLRGIGSVSIIPFPPTKLGMDNDCVSCSRANQSISNNTDFHFSIQLALVGS